MDENIEEQKYRLAVNNSMKKEQKHIKCVPRGSLCIRIIRMSANNEMVGDEQKNVGLMEREYIIRKPLYIVAYVVETWAMMEDGMPDPSE